MTFDNLNLVPQPGSQISGGGSDTVGQFTINGAVDANTPTCKFIKQYHQAHKV